MGSNNVKAEKEYLDGMLLAHFDKVLNKKRKVKATIERIIALLLQLPFPELEKIKSKAVISHLMYSYEIDPARQLYIDLLDQKKFKKDS